MRRKHIHSKSNEIADDFNIASALPPFLPKSYRLMDKRHPAELVYRLQSLKCRLF
jgi:hypothetical protein